MNKLVHIDSIRGVAILLVILVHSSHQLDSLHTASYWLSSYGQMGVQLFFIASAFTLCLSSERRKDELHARNKYAIRRIARIAPMYYFGIVFYFILSAAGLHNEAGYGVFDTKYTFANIASNLLFIHGFYEPAHNNIVPGGWSIGTEMAFYVIFPLLFVLASKYLVSGMKSTLSWIIAGLLLSQILILILGHAGMPIGRNNFIYYNLVNQLPVFLIGIAYYFHRKSRGPEQGQHVLFDILLFTFFTGVSLAFMLLRVDYLYSFIPFVSGLSFVFLTEIFRKSDFLNQPFLRRVGTLSYSIYILHFAVLGLTRKHLPLELSGPYAGELTMVIRFLIAVLLTYFAALISERFIEKPFIKMGRRLIRSYDSVAVQ